GRSASGCGSGAGGGAAAAASASASRLPPNRLRNPPLLRGGRLDVGPGSGGAGSRAGIGGSIPRAPRSGALASYEATVSPATPGLGLAGERRRLVVVVPVARGVRGRRPVAAGASGSGCRLAGGAVSVVEVSFRRAGALRPRGVAVSEAG